MSNVLLTVCIAIAVPLVGYAIQWVWRELGELEKYR